MKALICWEYGMGLGHLTRIKCLIEELSCHNIEVFLLTRDLHKSKIFQNQNVKCLPAPQLRALASNYSAICHADMLKNLGYDQKEKLETYIRAWKNVIDLISPDFIFLDHSPTALLAAEGSSAVKITFGNTFCVPNHSFPFGLYQTDKKLEAIKVENEVVSTINDVMKVIFNKNKSYTQLSELYKECDYDIFCSYSKFDNFPRQLNNSSQFYAGTQMAIVGESPDWPLHTGRDKKIFAYLKSGQYLIEIINALILSDASCILYIDGDFKLNAQLPENIKIVRNPMNIYQVLDSADLLISNGGLNTTSQFIQNSKPVLLWPLQIEQLLFSQNLSEKSLAGIISQQNHSGILNSILHALEIKLPIFNDDITPLATVVDTIVGGACD